jgi:hypothetical protein
MPWRLRRVTRVGACTRTRNFARARSSTPGMRGTRALLILLTLTAGLSVTAIGSPAYAWYDSWGRWHPNHVYHPYHHWNYGYYHHHHHHWHPYAYYPRY